MWRAIRVVILLAILATVAQTAWLTRARTSEWRTSLRVVVYPINGDTTPVTAKYIAEIKKEKFDPIEEFFEAEAKHFDIALADPIDIFLAPPIASPPPAAPFGRGWFDIMMWSLKLRYWAWQHDTYKGPKADVRLFVQYYDPAADSALPHSTGIQKGMLGIVNVYASSEMEGSNAIVIAHELLHTFGATDKYDRGTNQPHFPEGYGDAEAKPLHPQRRAEIMAGRLALTETRSEIPTTMKRVVIGSKTAREINWVK